MLLLMTSEEALNALYESNAPYEYRTTMANRERVLKKQVYPIAILTEINNRFVIRL